MLRENRPIGEFIDARYTFLNEQLAKHYGIDGVTGPDFRRVDLTTSERGGVLSQGSVLAVSSYPTRTSVVIRGKYILQNILGTPPPPPPPDVPPLDEQAVGTTASLRQQMESASVERHLRVLPLAHGSARLRARELRCHRQVADDGRRTSRWIRAASCRTARSSRRPPRCARSSAERRPEFSPDADREAADLRSRPRPRALRPADRPGHHHACSRPPATASRRWSGRWCDSLPFQSRRGEAVPTVVATK